MTQFLNFDSAYKNGGTIVKCEPWNVSSHEKAVLVR